MSVDRLCGCLSQICNPSIRNKAFLIQRRNLMGLIILPWLCIPTFTKLNSAPEFPTSQRSQTAARLQGACSIYCRRGAEVRDGACWSPPETSHVSSGLQLSLKPRLHFPHVKMNAFQNPFSYSLCCLLYFAYITNKKTLYHIRYNTSSRTWIIPTIVCLVEWLWKA